MTAPTSPYHAAELVARLKKLDALDKVGKCYVSDLDLGKVAAVIEALQARHGAMTVKPLVWVQSEYFASVFVAWDDLFKCHVYAESPDDKPRVEAKRAARILSALDVGQKEVE